MNILVGLGIILICIIIGAIWLWVATVKIKEDCPRD